jgi:hypothetical protein
LQVQGWNLNFFSEESGSHVVDPKEITSKRYGTYNKREVPVVSIEDWRLGCFFRGVNKEKDSGAFLQHEGNFCNKQLKQKMAALS